MEEQSNKPRWQERRQAGRDECCPAWRTHQHQSSAGISEGQDTVKPLKTLTGDESDSHNRENAWECKELSKRSASTTKAKASTVPKGHIKNCLRSRNMTEGEQGKDNRFKWADYIGKLGWSIWRYGLPTTTTTTMDRKKIKKTTKGATPSSTIEGADGGWIGFSNKRRRNRKREETKSTIHCPRQRRRRRSERHWKFEKKKSTVKVLQRTASKKRKKKEWTSNTMLEQQWLGKTEKNWWTKCG